MPTRRGFSLVELLIVLAVIGIMSGLVAPKLLDALPGMRVSGATRQVLADLRFARTCAIEKGIPVVVKFTPASGGYVVGYDRSNPPNDDYDGAGSEDGAAIRVADLMKEFSDVEFGSGVGGTPAAGVDLSAGVADAITFQANGSARESGQVYLRPRRDATTGRTDRTRRVRVVMATGNVRIERYKGGGVWE